MRTEFKTDAIKASLLRISGFSFLIVLIIIILNKQLLQYPQAVLVFTLFILADVLFYLFVAIVKIKIESEQIIFFTYFKIKKNYSIKNLIKVSQGYISNSFIIHFDSGDSEGVWVFSGKEDIFFQIIKEIAEWKRKNINDTEGIIYKGVFKKEVKL